MLHVTCAIFVAFTLLLRCFSGGDDWRCIHGSIWSTNT